MSVTRAILLLIPALCLVCTSHTLAASTDTAEATTSAWPNGPTFKQLPSDSEILSKRALTAKHFMNQDGSCTAVISSAPVHYLSQDGWCDIDTRILKSVDHPHYQFQNHANNFQSYFAADAGSPAGSQLAYQGARLTHWLDVRMSWTDPSGAEHQVCDVSAVKARVDGSRIIFQDSLPNVDVEFTVTKVGLRRAIVFKHEPVCLTEAEDGSWLNIVERLVLPVGYCLSLGAERQTGGFAADGHVDIRDGRGSGFVTMGPLKVTRVGTRAPSAARSGRRWFQLVGDSLYCYNQIPVEWLTREDGLTRHECTEDRGLYSVRATTVLRPTVAEWWTGSIQDDGGGEYSANDEYMFVSTTNYVVGYRAWVQFDVSSVAGEDVTDSLLNLCDHCGEDNGMYADYFHMSSHPSMWASLFPADIWTDIRDGTQYCNNQVWYTMQWTGDVDLGPQADDDIKNAPTSGSYQWFAVGLSSDQPDMWYEGLRALMYGYNGGANAPKLTVTYTESCTPPTITSGATGGGTVIEGDPGPVTFSVTATGDPAPTYQWKRDGIDVSDEAGHIQGATTDTLVITNVELSDDGDYTCVATNDCGQDTSDPATLTVRAIGDVNCDGSINGLDIDPFVLALTATPPDYPEYYAEHPDCDVALADCDANGSINGLDIDPFVNLLTGGG